MAAQQKWGWDLEDIRKAGQMQAKSPMLVMPCTPPVISGFTPINQSQLRANYTDSASDEGQSRHASKRQPQYPVSNDNQAEPRVSKRLAFSRSVDVKKPKRKQPASRSKNKNISKDLPRTKPGLDKPPIISDHATNSFICTTSLSCLRKGFDPELHCVQALHEEDEITSSNFVGDSRDSPCGKHRIILRETRQGANNLKDADTIVDSTAAQPQQKSLDEVETQESQMLKGIEQELAKPESSEDSITECRSVQEFDEWPDDVSMPDAVIIFDEEIQRSPPAVSQRARTQDKEPKITLRPSSGNIKRAAVAHKAFPFHSENEFDDPDLDSSLIHLDSPSGAHQHPTSQTSPVASSNPKLEWLPPKAFSPCKTQARMPLVSNDTPFYVPKDAWGAHLPFVRPPFPKPIGDQSSIFGLTNATVLRTCFRVGEALNAAAQASRSKVDAIVELYARVIASSRDDNGGFKQFFRFADLFTDKPPYLSGTSSIWRGVELWDQDSRVFVGEAGESKMCRVLGRIKKGEGQQGRYGMTVLCIWEVDWEDVGIAKGIICS